MHSETGEMLLHTLPFPLLSVYKDRRIFKAKAIVWGGVDFVKFHVYGIVYKMHIKGIFLSIPVILEKFMPRS